MIEEAIAKQPMPKWLDATETPNGIKNLKPGCLGYMDPIGLEALGQVAGFGASKYKPFGFMKGGMKDADMYNAAMRHMQAYWRGEYIDPESGKPHLAHAAWHMLHLIALEERGLVETVRPWMKEGKDATDADNAEETGEGPGGGSSLG